VTNSDEQGSRPGGKPAEEPEDASAPKADTGTDAETDSETASESKPEPDQSDQRPSIKVRPARKPRTDPIPYSATRSFAPLSDIPIRSEATFVPQEPKLYLPPVTDDDDADADGGFKAVPADTWRLFVAIELPRALKREFIDLARSFRPREHERVRWIEQDAMHLTLKFLGDTPTGKVSDIKTTLERAASSTGKFSIKIGRTGCFPSFRDPRICWIGLIGELRRLEQLQGRVEGGLVALGFDPEERKFKPHVTIGRTRPGIRGRFAEDIGVSWRHAPLHSTGTSLPVSAIALYRSYLGEKDEALYEQLGNWELG